MYWPKEVNIPDESNLFCRVHKGYLSKNNKSPSPSAFFNTPKSGNNLSTDWDKYSTPQESHNRIGKQFRYNEKTFKNKFDFFIYSLNVGKLRFLNPAQKIEHDPVQNIPEIIGTPNNRSHSIIIGDKGDKNHPEIRLKIVEIGEWAIGPE